MNTDFIKSGSLQNRFILVTSLAVIGLMIIIGVIATEREKKILYQDIERRGRLLAHTLAIPIVNDLLYEKLGLIEEGGLIDNYISEIFARKDIELLYLGVLDEEGRVIAHNDFGEYGKFYDDDMTLKAMSSDSTIVQRFYYDGTGHKAMEFATPLSIGKKRWGTLKFAISLRTVEAEIRTTVVSVIIFTVFLLIGCFGIIIALSRRFIAPITQLSQTMEEAGGDRLDVKVDIKGDDEIANLGHSFNMMIDRIRESNIERELTHEKLLRFARIIEKTSGNRLDVKVDIEGDDEIANLAQNFNMMIDSIRKSNIELQETHEKLLQSQKHASIGILAAGVAHEINNPLGGMLNCVQMLQNNGDNEEFRKRYLGLLKDGLDRIESTVSKLLWMSRKGEKRPQVVEVSHALRDALEFVEYRIVEGGIEYKESLEDDISVVMDPHDLEQILINLIINAIDSMKNGGDININIYRDEPSVIIEVSDTGEGIDADKLDRIFDPFYTTKQPGKGTGLGLWLTYEIVESYGGEISVRSKRGVGSTFAVKLNSGPLP